MKINVARCLLLLVSFGSGGIVLASAKPCTSESKTDETCIANIVDLKPTQFAVGGLEIEERKAEFEDMEDYVLDQYIKDHEAPAVLGPDHRYYLLDRHHLARALQEMGKGQLRLLVTAKWEELSFTEFWARMNSNHWVYLYDEKGNGPHRYEELPQSIMELKNDPYRSLAWGVRKEGGYEKSDVSFADFAWANFFRERISVELITSDFEKATEQGVRWAHSREAQNLPGYLGLIR